MQGHCQENALFLSMRHLNVENETMTQKLSVPNKYVLILSFGHCKKKIVKQFLLKREILELFFFPGGVSVHILHYVDVHSFYYDIVLILDSFSLKQFDYIFLKMSIYVYVKRVERYLNFLLKYVSAP